MPYGEQDLRGFFRTGPVVSFGGISTYPDGQPVQGLLDQPIQVRGADSGIGGVDLTLPVLHLPYNAFFPMPAVKQTITVGGANYRVAGVTAVDDGLTVCLDLKNA